VKLPAGVDEGAGRPSLRRQRLVSSGVPRRLQRGPDGSRQPLDKGARHVGPAGGEEQQRILRHAGGAWAAAASSVCSALLMRDDLGHQMTFPWIITSASSSMASGEKALSARRPALAT
jgi:hypothetical protein